MDPADVPAIDLCNMRGRRACQEDGALVQQPNLPFASPAHLNLTPACSRA